MTDNEIIKALEYCAKDDNKCKDCDFNKYNCLFVFPKECLNLINRQKAEIERLKHRCFGIQNELEAYKDTFNTAIDETESEAIKEFAARLKEFSTIDDLSLDGRYYVYVDEIDEFVKEMTD